MSSECFLCATNHLVCTESGRTLTAKARTTLENAAKSRNDDLIKHSLLTKTSIWVSNACYRRYTDPRQFNKPSPSSSSSSNNDNNNNNNNDNNNDNNNNNDDEAPYKPNQSFERRHRSTAYCYKMHCLICEGVLNFDLAKKNPSISRYQISEVTTIISKTKDKGKSKLHETLKQVVRTRNDPLALEVAAKLEYASCIRAEEAKYHRDCMQRFLTGKAVVSGPITHKHVDKSKNDGFNKFCDWYESTSHDTTSAFTLFEVQTQIEEHCTGNEEPYSLRQLSRKLSDRYGAEGSEVRLTQRPGLPKIMLMQEEADAIVSDTVMDSPVGIAGKIINEFLHEDPQTEEDEDPPTEEDEQIEPVTVDSTFYPYPNELTQETLLTEIPEPLKDFLDVVYSKSRTDSAKKKKELRKIAVAHALMQFCKKEGYISPLLLAIGLFVHQVSRSRLLVDILHSVGFSVSYSEVLKFEKSAAVSSVQFDSDSELESEEVFWQFIADNLDHNEDTTTGANTTHVMGVISCATPKSDLSKIKPIQRKEVSSAELLEAVKFNENIKVYKKPSKSKFKEIKLQKLTNSNIDSTQYQKLDLFWIFSSLFVNDTPNWHGFMASVTPGTHLPSQIKYHPNIPLDPSSYDAVYSTMSFVKEQIKQKKICCTSLTFDQPLYWKASEIKADKSPELDCIHLKLGGFHQLMSFLGAGCKLMQDAGMKELWSTVYKENSLPKMMEGKAYSRCLRACLLTDAALHFTLLCGSDHSEEYEEIIFEPVQTFNNQEDFADFVDDGNLFDNLNNDSEKFENIDYEDDSDISSVLLQKLKSNCDSNDGLMMFNEETAEELRKLYESFEKQQVTADQVCNDPVLNGIGDIVSNLKFVQDVSRTGKHWLQFMDFVSIVRMFLRAERTANWDLHLSASEQMVPILAAAGHDKYVLAVLKYLQDMKNLCPCLEKKYKEGAFTICRNNKLFWSGTFTDQIIEQTLMRSAKTQGGLINITHNDAARTKWLLSSHIVANYTEALRDLTGVTTGTWSEQHRDVQASRRRENSQHLRNFIDFLDTHNPFKAPENKLVNIANGVIASNDVNVDQAIEIGERIVSSLEGKKLGDVSLKRKDQAKTFAVMRKVVKVGETDVQMSSDQLSQRLLADVVRDESPLLEIFSHELSAVAPSLFQDNGEMRKNNKSELMNELSTEILESPIDTSAFHVIDGCAWFYRIYWAKVGTISDLYCSFKQTIIAECGSNTNQVCVLFDGYAVETTKGPEQKRRKKNLPSVEIKVDWNLPIPQNMKNFLSSKSNKQQLIDLFSQKLLIDGIQVNQAAGDADMDIVKEALVKAKEFNIVVHSRDTDVFIALLYHLDIAIHNNVIMDTKKGYISISNLAEQLTSEIRECLPFAHAVSGCDTVSATYGLGKTRAYKKLKESANWRNLMNCVGEDDVDDVDGEQFYLDLYGTLGTKADSLNHLREIMYTVPKYIPISRMPPTSRSFRFHMLRTHLEANTCKNLEQRLKEEDHGFTRNSNGELIPIITDMPPAPSYLLQNMKCSCSKPNRAGLLCTGCSCSIKGLPCTLLCKCDGQCENNRT